MNLIHANPLSFIPGGYSILPTPQCRSLSDSMAHIMRHFISSDGLGYANSSLPQCSDRIDTLKKYTGDKLTITGMSFFYACRNVAGRLWGRSSVRRINPDLSVAPSLIPDAAVIPNILETVMQIPFTNSPEFRAELQLKNLNHNLETHEISGTLPNILKASFEISFRRPERQSTALIVFDLGSNALLAVGMPMLQRSIRWTLMNGQTICYQKNDNGISEVAA